VKERGRVIILMGVSGAGKTTVGREVARRLGRDFIDADDYRSAEALKKMSSGLALDDADRGPWPPPWSARSPCRGTLLSSYRGDISMELRQESTRRLTPVCRPAKVSPP
jgi:hypothetical protein